MPIPSIPNAKNPGTMFNTVAPQLVVLYKAESHALMLLPQAAVFTSVDIGPIKDTPTRTATNPPIKLAIIFTLSKQPFLLCVSYEMRIYLNVGA